MRRHIRGRGARRPAVRIGRVGHCEGDAAQRVNACERRGSGRRRGALVALLLLAAAACHRTRKRPFVLGALLLVLFADDLSADASVNEAAVGGVATALRQRDASPRSSPPPPPQPPARLGERARRLASSRRRRRAARSTLSCRRMRTPTTHAPTKPATAPARWPSQETSGSPGLGNMPKVSPPKMTITPIAMHSSRTISGVHMQ